MGTIIGVYIRIIIRMIIGIHSPPPALFSTSTARVVRDVLRKDSIRIGGIRRYAFRDSGFFVGSIA